MPRPPRRFPSSHPPCDGALIGPDRGIRRVTSPGSSQTKAAGQRHDLETAAHKPRDNFFPVVQRARSHPLRRMTRRVPIDPSADARPLDGARHRPQENIVTDKQSAAIAALKKIPSRGARPAQQSWPKQARSRRDSGNERANDGRRQRGKGPAQPRSRSRDVTDRDFAPEETRRPCPEKFDLVLFTVLRQSRPHAFVLLQAPPGSYPK